MASLNSDEQLLYELDTNDVLVSIYSFLYNINDISIVSYDDEQIMFTNTGLDSATLFAIVLSDNYLYAYNYSSISPELTYVSDHPGVATKRAAYFTVTIKNVIDISSSSVYISYSDYCLSIIGVKTSTNVSEVLAIGFIQGKHLYDFIYSSNILTEYTIYSDSTFSIVTSTGEEDYTFIGEQYKNFLIINKNSEMISELDDYSFYASFDTINTTYTETVQTGTSRDGNPIYTKVTFAITDNGFGLCDSTLLEETVSHGNIVKYNELDNYTSPSFESLGDNTANGYYDDIVVYTRNNAQPKSVNTLNNISLILPSLFYVRRSPVVKDVWGYIGKSSGINYVSMYNMSSLKIVQSDYPVSGDKYACFALYERRTKSFLGVAVKLTKKLVETRESDNVVLSIQ